MAKESPKTSCMGQKRDHATGMQALEHLSTICIWKAQKRRRRGRNQQGLHPPGGQHQKREIDYRGEV